MNCLHDSILENKRKEENCEFAATGNCAANQRASKAMEIASDNSKFLEKLQWRWISFIYSAVIMGAVQLIVIGCAGPFEHRIDQPGFDHWVRLDHQLFYGRNIDLYQPSELNQHAEPDRDLPEDATFDDYVRYAVIHNPALEAAFYRWRAALERVPQARALSDPQASFAVVIDQMDRSAQYMGERYSISQMFPWFGKLKLRGDMALEEAHAEGRRFEAARLELIDRVGRVYFEYAYLHQAIAIARENLELLIRLESVSRAMYRAGTVSLSDVNRAQVEIGRIEDQVRSLEDLLGVAVGDLNAVLGRPVQAYLPPVPPGSSTQKVTDSLDYSDEHWIDLAKQYNPELASTRYDATRERHGAELSRKDYFPDIMLGVEYARDGSARMATMDGGGSDMLSLMVSINLPIRREKYGAGLRETMARFGEATRQMRSREHNLESELKRALYEYRDSGRKVELYGGTLLPKANESLSITEAAYRTGDTGFSDLIDAQRVLLEFALAHERAAADWAKALIRVRTLVGYDPDLIGK